MTESPFLRRASGLALLAAGLSSGCGSASDSTGPGRPGTGNPDGGGAGDGSPGVGAGDAAMGGDGTGPTDGGGIAHRGPAGELDLTLGGSTLGVDYASLDVAGTAKLGGALVLTFASGFVPRSGQRFVVVTAQGGVVGAFDSITTNGARVTAGQDARTFYVTVN